VQADASFCGQCGFNLKSVAGTSSMSNSSEMPDPQPSFPSESIVPDPLVTPDPLVFPEPPTINVHKGGSTPDRNAPSMSEGRVEPPSPPVSPPPEQQLPPPEPLAPPTPLEKAAPANPIPMNTATQLQQFSARLLHLQTTNVVELPPGLPVIHIGKPNDQIPPDIDVSGYPNSEIVSRIHADLRVEGDAYYIEDVGSSNGTYINNVPLPMGNRHRLRSGDRISLGKGDKVTFLFQMA
jgi:hypothetical protein